jgi:hypothetical protein
MAKFYGAVGYADTSTEVSPGVWEDVIVERKHRGDVLRATRSLQQADEKVNSDISVDNEISIVADAYASGHIFAIRYVRWAGALWIVSHVEVQSPRLILRLGGVYNGLTGEPASPS